MVGRDMIRYLCRALRLPPEDGSFLAAALQCDLHTMQGNGNEDAIYSSFRICRKICIRCQLELLKNEAA